VRFTGAAASHIGSSPTALPMITNIYLILITVILDKLPVHIRFSAGPCILLELLFANLNGDMIHMKFSDHVQSF
jgi:hypothetical protein